MRFYLGKRPVVTINDGSIIVEYSRHTSRMGTWGIKDDSRIIKPVISIEVLPPIIIKLKIKAKRKRAKGTEAEWRHAGQIFCEMLGQVCHPELYAVGSDEFLEVEKSPSAQF